MQINVNPNGEQVYHVIAVHLKQHWFKELSPMSIVALITDNSNVTLEVQHVDVVEAIAEGSGLENFHQFLGLIIFSYLLSFDFFLGLIKIIYVQLPITLYIR